MEPKQINPITNHCKAICSLKSILAIICIALIFAGNLSAQHIWEERKGYFRSQGNLGGGYLFKQKTVPGYLNGEMELFLEDRVAFTGAICYSFNTTRKNQAGITANHALFAGINYHFLKPGRLDPYIGLTPGLGLVRASYQSGEELKSTPYSLTPLLSAQLGCNFYVCSFMHFFVKTQGVVGQIFSTLPSAQRIDEFKFMAGLGWNFRLYKPKIKDKW